MQITLSTSDTVYLQDGFTHQMHKARFKALNRGVEWVQNAETGEFEKRVPAENIEFQYEDVIPLVVTRITKDGKDVPCTPEWVQGLLQDDYQKLETAIGSIRNGNTVTDEAGEKKA